MRCATLLLATLVLINGIPAASVCGDDASSAGHSLMLAQAAPRAWDWPSYGDGYGYGEPHYYSPPSSLVPLLTPIRSNYYALPILPPKEPSATVMTAAPIYLRVIVPPQARLWIDGLATKNTGAVRDFVSSPVELGHHYFYLVRAAWQQDGREIAQQRRVAVKAGDTTRIEFAEK